MAGAIIETIDVDAGPGLAGLKEFTDALEQAADKWAEFQAKMDSGLAGGSADKLAASMDEAAAAISAAADKAAASLERIGEASDSAAGGVERLDEAAATAGGSLDEAAAGADAAAAASDRLAESADAASASLDRQAVSGKAASDSAGESAAASEGFGSTAKLALLGIGVAAAYGIDKAMKFQSQMLLLNTQAGVSMPNVKKMSQGVLEISTQTGQSLSNVSESAYHVASNMASMGSTVPNMLNAVKVAAQGATVGHANMVDVTNALTAAIASGIPGVKNYQQAMGVLNSTVGSGDMTMQDLADAFGTGMVASVKGYGLSIKDVGAALATFGDNNIRGAKAGTDLRMAVQALAVPVSTAAPELAKLGLTTNSLAKDMQSGGLLKALDDLQSKFTKNGITAKNEGQVITDLFGKKAGVGLSLLMEQMDRLQSKYPALTKGANDFGAAWQKTQETPAQKWKELGAGLQASAVNFGTSLLPAFSAAAGFADKILDDINSTKGAADGLAVAFGAAVAVFTTKKLVSGVQEAFETGEKALGVLGKIGQTIGIPGADKLAGAGQGSASSSMAGAADTQSAAAKTMADAAATQASAADKMASAATGQETAGAEEETAASGQKVAGAEEDAGGGLLGKGGITGAVGTAGIGLIISSLIDSALKGQKNSQGNWLDNAFGTPSKSGWNSWSSFGHDIGDLWGALPGGTGNAAAASAGGVSRSEARFGIPAPGTSSSAPAAAAVPAPDLSALADAKTKAAQDMAGIGEALDKVTKPAKIAAPDLSALSDAKAKAAQDADGITTAMKTPLDKPVKATAPDLSAYAAAKGKAAADGAQIDAGLAAGILAGEGAAVAAAQQVASAVSAAMSSALKVSSPSKVTEKIGASAAQGLVVGLEGGTSAVNAAATALGKNVAKAADITTLDSNVTKLLAYVPSGDTGLTKMLKADQGKLTTLANQRQTLETEITDSQQIAQQALSNSSILNAASYTPALAASNGPQSSYATVQGLQSMLADQQAFTQQIGQLKKQGLNATSLNQLVQGGASSGLPITAGLIGNKGAIAQINQLEAKLHSSAAQLGDEAAGPMFQAGQQAAQGLAEGIKSELGAVDNAIKAMAQSMVNAAKEALKSKSPSLVFRDVGLSIPQGVALGVDAGTPVAQAAVGRMGSRLGGGHPGIDYGHAGGGGGGGGGTVTIHNVTNVTVQGSVTTENDLLTKLQSAQLKKANNNWQGGWQLPGRKT